MLRKLLPVGIILGIVAVGCAGLALLNATLSSVLLQATDPTRPLLVQLAATQTAESARAQLTATATQAAQATASTAPVTPWLWPALVAFMAFVGLMVVLAERHEKGLDWAAVEQAAESNRQMAPFYLAEPGATPIPLAHLLADPGLVLALEAERTRRLVGIAQAQAEPAYPLLQTLTQHHAPSWSHSVLPGQAAPPPPLALAGPEPAAQLAPGLPDACTLLDVMRAGFTPTPDAILLGLGPGGERITVPADETLCHILIAGQTGKGKSVLFRLLLAQLLAVGVPAYLLDLTYADFDARRHIDRRPLAARLASPPLTDPAAIARFFGFLAGPELTKRKTAMQTTGDPGLPFFVFADEWAQLMEADRERIAPPARQCLRLYRQYGGYFGIGTQDALVDTMGNNSGVLAQFPTGYYVGGDPTTRRRVTNLSGAVPEPPGKGVVYLRAAVQNPATLVRIPQVGNPDLYELLGAPASPPPWGWEGVTRHWRGGSVATVPATAVATGGYTAATPAATPERARVAGSSQEVAGVAISDEARTALTAFRAGKTVAEIVSELRGVSSNQGARYQAAALEIQALLRAALPPEDGPA